ncbi:tRNA1(Val) (adenine(37)-N6)-methyltransferase [Psychroflexus planctonicus]|uniref:tRNA1(Val) (adenine(37)-N6)-methyltransferase n=1 Tax=Psychroflexus planctonicus TaxID=1526575 RepID=A0ABQ1SKK3_9FLAO|nr:methyltransferase [Psychroflexus planctonicus]GGE40015.1 tRNA1(Val) (adenine(37)-N6)-methyltransferase [Psychroflexus planctonicus]
MKFQFKEFSIQQDKTAMKVGTDGVLLGAWASLKHQPDAILDIGAGTGIIALQMAQRSTAELIDAIELDDDAFEQCVDNFENSPWSDRLFCYHASFQEFVEEIDETYQSIVSNPPFFNQKNETRPSNARNTARFTDTLPFEDLLSGVKQLLTKDGVFSCILPEEYHQEFIDLAKTSNLFLNRVCFVKGNPTSPVKRCLMEFSFQQKELQTEHLIIELERHQYTKDYIALTKDFYLKM